MHYIYKNFFTFFLMGYSVFTVAQEATGEEIIDENDDSSLSGMQIMEEVYSRHQQFPYIYEEQSLVLIDKNGFRDTRKARRYSRVEEDGTARFLLLFESPSEVSGVALLANRDPSGNTSKSVYLPAFGEHMFESSSNNADGNFLGTDFSVENLVGEVLSDYQYVRRKDTNLQNMDYFVLDVYRKSDDLDKTLPLRKHFVRKDNYYIVATEHYDKRGRTQKHQSHHDLKPVDGHMWRANMILMEDKKEQHQSLVKILRRVFSRDYVPENIFTAEWLYENYPALMEETLSDNDEDNESDSITQTANADDQQELMSQ